MSLPYIQSTMQSARVGADSQIQYPFLSDGDTQTKVYRMRCQQIAEYYNPAQVALDTPMTSAAAAGVIALPFGADSSAYYVGDENISPQPGGMIRFDRVFANIPQPRVDQIGTQSYTYPGLGGFIVSGQYKESTVSSLSMILGTAGVYVTTSAAHELAVDDIIHTELVYTISGDDTTYSSFIDTRVLQVVNTTQIRIDIGRQFNEQATISLVSGTITRPSTYSRSRLTLSTPMTESFTYILPGVTSGISDVGDIVPCLPFSPRQTVVAEGQPTVRVTPDTLYDSGVVGQSATQPTVSEYWDLVKNKAQLVVSSSIEQWMGNIYVQRIRQVQAQ